jgi:predicted transcriptional regulator
MTQSIHISEHAAQQLVQLQAMTGQTAEQIIDRALEEQLAAQEMELLRAAVKLGADQADRGEFSTRTVKELIAEGIALAKNLPPLRD